jgi:hypothetical protein
LAATINGDEAMPKRKQKTVKAEDRRKPLMEWTVHLARRQPFKAAIVVLVIALTLAVGWLWVHPLIAFLMGLFLLNAVGEFLFPLRFRVTREGVEVSSFLHDRKLRWEQIRRMEVHPDGIFLSPYPKPTQLDNLRGIWLRWDGEPEGLQRLVKICQANINVP